MMDEETDCYVSLSYPPGVLRLSDIPHLSAHCTPRAWDSAHTSARRLARET